LRRIVSRDTTYWMHTTLSRYIWRQGATVAYKRRLRGTCSLAGDPSPSNYSSCAALNNQEAKAKLCLRSQSRGPRSSMNWSQSERVMVSAAGEVTGVGVYTLGIRCMAKLRSSMPAASIWAAWTLSRARW